MKTCIHFLVVKYFTCLLAGLCIAKMADAQGEIIDSTQGKDTFMIWTGHWQAHGIFIANNGAVITYDTIKRKPVFTMPAARNQLQDIVDEVNNTEKKEDDLKQAAKSDENGYKNYPIVKEAIKYYEKLKEEMKDIVLKDINWGDNDKVPPLGPASLKNYVLDACTKLKPDYDAVIAYAKSVKGKKDFDTPVPPAADYFNCWGCNQKKRDEYDTLVAHYARDFFKEDKAQIGKALDMISVLNSFGRGSSDKNFAAPGYEYSGTEAQALEEAFGNGKRPTACTYLVWGPDELIKSIRTIVIYGLRRADTLWRKYKKDHQRLDPIVRVMLSASWQAQLMQVTTDKEEAAFLVNAGENIQKLYEEWSDKLIKDLDYSKLADIPSILGMSWLVESLVGPKNAYLEKKDKDRLEALLSFDRFKLTIDLDTKVGENQNYDNLHFHSEGYVIAVFDSGDCVHWVPAGLAAKDKNMFLPVKLLVAEKAYVGPHPEYTGTRNFFIPLNLKIHFCENEGKDTMIFPINFLPDPTNGSTWVSEGKTVNIAADEHGISIFKDAKKYKDEIVTQSHNNNTQDIEEKKRKNQELLNKMNELKARGLNKEQMMEEMSKLLKEAQAGNNNSNSKALSQLAFPIHFQNKNSVLIDEKFDAKKLNPSMADKIVYGTLAIKLEHDPRAGF